MTQQPEQMAAALYNVAWVGLALYVFLIAVIVVIVVITIIVEATKKDGADTDGWQAGSPKDIATILTIFHIKIAVIMYLLEAYSIWNGLMSLDMYTSMGLAVLVVVTVGSGGTGRAFSASQSIYVHLPNKQDDADDGLDEHSREYLAACVVEIERRRRDANNIT